MIDDDANDYDDEDDNDVDDREDDDDGGHYTDILAEGYSHRATLASAGACTLHALCSRQLRGAPQACSSAAPPRAGPSPAGPAGPCSPPAGAAAPGRKMQVSRNVNAERMVLRGP